MTQRATRAAALEAEADVPTVHTQERPARGRHRKPRPRRTLFAVSGLALAAGALSLVRLVPESVGGSGTGAMEAEPRAASEGVPEGAANAAATMEAGSPPAGPADPGATAVSGAGSEAPRGGRAVVTPPSPLMSPVTAAAVPSPGPTGIPTGPVTDAPAPAATSSAAPRPTPSTTAPAARPERPEEREEPDERDHGDVCVPVIALCLDADTGGGHGDGLPG